MVRIVFSLFIVLHGLVHLLYVGQSARVFELQPGMAWPDGSLMFGRLLGEGAGRTLASVLLGLAAVTFVAGGAGILARQAWWRGVVVGAACLSAAIYLVFWDGRFQNLPDKGAIALLINAAILVAVLVFKWPAPGF
jgi:hypothetical protein